MAIKHSSHARYDLWYHLAWSTKYRKPVFSNPEIQQEVKKLLRKIAAEHDMTIDTIEVMPDHVHFTLSIPPRIAPSQAVRIIKSVSTKILFQQYYPPVVLI